MITASIPIGFFHIGTWTPITHQLNKNFTMEELNKSIKNMDYKKAVSPDDIVNAFYKHATDVLLEILLMVINLNIKDDMTSSNWCHDFITPIHKEGPKHNPGNYRGLCIINSLPKLLCSLINERLTLYCNTNNLINKE